LNANILYHFELLISGSEFETAVQRRFKKKFIQDGPEVRDLPFQSMPEKGRRDSIIGTNRHWPELLAVKKES
jgi:hypothetical protein